MIREGIQDPDHVPGGGELLLLPGTDGQEADQGDDLIQSQEAGDDLKVLGGGDLILESVVEDLGAHPNPETKRKRRKKRRDLKLHQRAIAQPEDPEAQAERDDAGEAGVSPDHRKSLDLLRERCQDPLHQKDTKRKRKRIKTKREVEMNVKGQQARKRRAKIKRRIERENLRATKMSKSQEIMMKKNKATIVKKRRRKKKQQIPLLPNLENHQLKKGVEMHQGSPK